MLIHKEKDLSFSNVRQLFEACLLFFGKDTLNKQPGERVMDIYCHEEEDCSLNIIEWIFFMSIGIISIFKKKITN